MKTLGVTTVLCFLAIHAQAEKVRYDGHKVINIIPKRAQHVQDIMKLEDQFQLDFWRFPKLMNDNFHVRVSPQSFEPFLSKLREMEATVSVLIDDVQSFVDLESRQMHEQRKRRSTKSDILTRYQSLAECVNTYGASDWSTPRSLDSDWLSSGYFSQRIFFFTVEQIEAFVDNLPLLYQNVQVSNLRNQTYEGRNIRVVKISHVDGAAGQSIFIDCGIHAREWISPAFCLYAIDTLLSESEDDLLKQYNFHIVPVLNPDGYHYSMTDERFWRKNRRVNRNGGCRGVDLNRNFGFMYNPSVGGSQNKCSDIYTGTGPFSEAESESLEWYILNSNENFLSYLTVHSFGQMWLYPWGYTSEKPADVDDLHEAAMNVTTALTRVNGAQYRVGTSTEVLYSAAGGSDDWAKGGAGIKYSYTLELRDEGAYGFLLPENQIADTVTETWAGVKALADYILPL